METSPERPGPVVRGVTAAVFMWVWWRTINRDLDTEHPKTIALDVRAGRLADLARRVAAEIPDDGEAVAAIRAGGSRRKDLRIAAAWTRSDDYTWEHRCSLRAARLLKAAADGGPPVPPSPDRWPGSVGRITVDEVEGGVRPRG